MERESSKQHKKKQALVAKQLLIKFARSGFVSYLAGEMKCTERKQDQSHKISTVGSIRFDSNSIMCKPVTVGK
jgi:hypothetical protein